MTHLSTYSLDILKDCRNMPGVVHDDTLFSDLIRGLEMRDSGRSSAHAGNTYLKDFEIPQIELFDILANRFPLVLKAQEIVTHAICSVAAGQQRICLLDLGIGRGVQIVRVLQALDRVEGLEEVELIGVEIMEQALTFTAALIEKKKPDFRYRLTFRPVHLPVENTGMDELRSSCPDNNVCTIVNASLTLHHIQSENKRSLLLQKIAHLQPALLTLIEPNADCYTDDHPMRVRNAYEHFAALYHFIGTLGVSETAKKGLKQFFSNEFFDCVALADADRYERYSPASAWVKWAAEAGLVPFDLSAAGPVVHINGLDCHYDPAGYANFRSGNTDILSTLAFKYQPV